MTMPVNISLGKLGPINVSEDETHFLVHIHPENRERAKKIFGRQWDGERKAWVYPKDPSTYDALVEEFQKDADSFSIRRPKTKRPPGIKPPIKDSDNETMEEQLINEVALLSEKGEKNTKIHIELEQVRVMLESLRDGAVNQSRTLEELREKQDEALGTLIRLRAVAKQPTTTKEVEVLPYNLDLTKQKEIELLEKSLVMVARFTAGEQQSFSEWVNKYNPLSRPADFVNETHEFLKKQLIKILKDEDARSDFADLVKRVKDENPIYIDSSDPTIKPIPILFTLNTIRNRFAHPPVYFSQWEKWNKSILYLMNLAQVWPKIMMESGDNNE